MWRFRPLELHLPTALALCLLLLTGTVAAQTPPPQGIATSPAATSPQPGSPNAPVSPCSYQGPAPSVKAVTKDGPNPDGEVKLRDTIVVEVNHLRTLEERLACANLGGAKKKIVLYLDGRPLTDVTAYPPTDTSTGMLKFPLRRTEDSRPVWTHLLGKPKLGTHPVNVSVGIEDQYPIESKATLELRVLPEGWLAFWFLIFLILLIGFWFLALRSDLLRDNVPVTASAVTKRFSLARSQAAWWFFLILASYLLIGLVTGDFSTSITSTVLILLGISAGTALGSAVVDASKNTPAERTLRATEVEKIEQDLLPIGTAVRNAQANPAAPGALQVLTEALPEKENKESQLRKLRNQSEGFWRDILSDIDGVTFHRFQIAGWTVVLGIVFIVQVYRELAMPVFGETLLGLLGISSAAFLGLKGPEGTRPK